MLIIVVHDDIIAFCSVVVVTIECQQLIVWTNFSNSHLCLGEPCVSHCTQSLFSLIKTIRIQPCSAKVGEYLLIQPFFVKKKLYINHFYFKRKDYKRFRHVLITYKPSSLGPVWQLDFALTKAKSEAHQTAPISLRLHVNSLTKMSEFTCRL